MLRHGIIGSKHAPERLMFRFALKHFGRDVQKTFYADYTVLLNKDYFVKLKKRTGKGTEYHISLNPEMIEELKELIGEENEIS